MDDGIDALEERGREAPNVPEVLHVDTTLRHHPAAGQHGRKVAHVETDERGARVRTSKVLDHAGTDVAHVAGDEDLHTRPVTR